MPLALTFVLACSIVAILYGVASSKWILSQPTGTERMREIALAIQQGACAYLYRQYTIISAVGLILFFIIGFIPAIGWPTAFAFAVGAIFSGAAGYIGMNISIRANVRTTEAARSSGLKEALKIAGEDYSPELHYRKIMKIYGNFAAGKKLKGNFSPGKGFF